MTDYKAIMEKIAEEFPPPPEELVEKPAGSGYWDLDALTELLTAIQEAHPDFAFTDCSRKDGYCVVCPGNTRWPDGEEHTRVSHRPNESTIVYIEDGWANFSCRHSHCSYGAEHGKKRFKHFLDYYDPTRALIDYPVESPQDRLERLRRMAAEAGILLRKVT